MGVDPAKNIAKKANDRSINTIPKFFNHKIAKLIISDYGQWDKDFTLEILEQFGIPISVAMAFGFFIWKQNKFIQDTLMEELEESFKRLEGIIVQLINQQKLMQIEQKGIEKSFNAIVNIRLS